MSTLRIEDQHGGRLNKWRDRTGTCKAKMPVFVEMGLEPSSIVNRAFWFPDISSLEREQRKAEAVLSQAGTQCHYFGYDLETDRFPYLKYRK